jgi:hypothetical protein
MISSWSGKSRFEGQDGIDRSSPLGIANLSLPILRTALRLEHFNSPHAVLQALEIF